MTAQRLKLRDILEKIKSNQQLNSEEVELMEALNVTWRVLINYVEDELLALVNIVSGAVDARNLMDYKMSVQHKGKTIKIINITAYAKDKGCSTQSVTKLLKSNGYIVKHDRGRVFYKNKVITYIEV